MQRAETERLLLAAKWFYYYFSTIFKFLPPYHVIISNVQICSFTHAGFPTCTDMHGFAYTHKISDTKNLQFMKVVLIFSRVSRYCTWFFYFKDYNTNLKNKGSLSIVFGG